MATKPWFGVYIIDALKQDDQLLGADLKATCEERGIWVKGHYAETARQFARACTDGLRETFGGTNLLPVLHICCHGYWETQADGTEGPGLGIELPNGDTLDWDGLARRLYYPAKALRYNSLLCLSTCKGADGVEELMAKVNLAGVVAPLCRVWPDDSADAYAMFYHMLDYTGGRIWQSYQAMHMPATMAGKPGYVLRPDDDAKAIERMTNEESNWYATLDYQTLVRELPLALHHPDDDIPLSPL